MPIECNHTICNPCLFEQNSQLETEIHQTLGIYCCDNCEGSIRPAPLDVRLDIIRGFFETFKTTKEYKSNTQNIACPGYEVENMLPFI